MTRVIRGGDFVQLIPGGTIRPHWQYWLSVRHWRFAYRANKEDWNSWEWEKQLKQEAKHE